MSMIKAWLHDQMEEAMRGEGKIPECYAEDEMFFNADKHHELQQAMMEEMDEPQNPEDHGIDPNDTSNTQQTNEEVPF